MLNWNRRGYTDEEWETFWSYIWSDPFSLLIMFTKLSPPSLYSRVKPSRDYFFKRLKRKSDEFKFNDKLE